MLKKGTVIGKAEIAALKAAGIAEIVVARLEPGDVSEDAAAAEIAAAVAGEGVRVDRAFTGRANLFAEIAGVLVVDKDGDRSPQPGRRVDHVRDAAGLQAGGRRRDDRDRQDHSLRGRGAGSATPRLRSARRRARWSGSRPTAFARSASSRRCCRASPARSSRRPCKVTEERLAPAGATIVAERRVPHEQGALAKAIEEVLGEGAELVIVFGASAIADRRDVIPAAVEAIGGRIEHFGMPVDPGNLLLVADARGRPVLGAPGCARSPKENGFDWVLMRLLAGLAGAARGHHRHGRRRAADGDRHAAAAARRSRRPSPRGASRPSCSPPAARPAWADRTSCLAEIARRPLVRIAVEEALASRAKPVIVVTGHQRDEVEKALAGLPVRLVHNPDFARRARHLAQGRHRRRAGRCRRRDRLPRRHAAGRCRA